MNNQQRISIVLGWGSNELTSMVYGSAFTWMRLQMFNDQQIELLSRCHSFWQWWTDEWFIRDGDYLWETSLRFLDEPLDGYELELALELYVKKHLVSRLDIQPNHFVVNELKQLVLNESSKKLTHTKNQFK